jgi:hypothetical protein
MNKNMKDSTRNFVQLLKQNRSQFQLNMKERTQGCKEDGSQAESWIKVTEKETDITGRGDGTESITR